MKIQEIRKMKTGDLDKKLSELRLELSKEFGVVKMGRATKNPGKIKQIKRDISRILTVKKESKLSKSQTTKSVKEVKGKNE